MARLPPSRASGLLPVEVRGLLGGGPGAPGGAGRDVEETDLAIHAFVRGYVEHRFFVAVDRADLPADLLRRM